MRRALSLAALAGAVASAEEGPAAAAAAAAATTGDGGGARRRRRRRRKPPGFDAEVFGKGRLWALALGASLLVSLASLLCLALVPALGGRAPGPRLVRGLSAFAVGALLGDAFLHQLPHAYAAAPHAHAHTVLEAVQQQAVGLSVLAGVLAFFLVEKLVHAALSANAPPSAAAAHAHGHGHGHAHGTSSAVATSASSAGLRQRKKTDKEEEENDPKEAGPPAEEEAPRLAAVGYLNLLADAVHNFTDGLAIGAAFLTGGPASGWSKTLFMLAHELPQEVGDFGILLQAGFSSPKALLFNFLSALVALAGTATALAVGGALPGGSALIEGFTAGGFIYLACAGVLPSMMHATSLGETAFQTAAIAVGMAVCVAIHASGGCDHDHGGGGGHAHGHTVHHGHSHAH